MCIKQSLARAAEQGFPFLAEILQRSAKGSTISYLGIPDVPGLSPTILERQLSEHGKVKILGIHPTSPQP